MSKNFYISDLHFRHDKVIQMDNRPFKDTQEMEKALITNWNNVVSPQDTVYILGDFCWSKEQSWIEILEQLNGAKQLIKGNHDIGPQKSKKYFQDIKDYKEIKDGDYKLILSHYPTTHFKNHYYEKYIHLYGHVHNTWEYKLVEFERELMTEMAKVRCEMYNVGCMMTWMNYTPRTLEEIIKGESEWQENKMQCLQ